MARVLNIKTFMTSTEVAEVDFIQAINKSPEGTLCFRVRWKGFGEESDTWEPEENLTECKEEIYNFFRDVPEAIDIYNQFYAEKAIEKGRPPPTPKKLQDFAVRKTSKKSVRQKANSHSRTAKIEVKLEHSHDEGRKSQNDNTNNENDDTNISTDNNQNDEEENTDEGQYFPNKKHKMPHVPKLEIQTRNARSYFDFALNNNEQDANQQTTATKTKKATSNIKRITITNSNTIIQQNSKRSAMQTRSQSTNKNTKQTPPKQNTEQIQTRSQSTNINSKQTTTRQTRSQSQMQTRQKTQAASRTTVQTKSYQETNTKKNAAVSQASQSHRDEAFPVVIISDSSSDSDDYSESQNSDDSEHSKPESESKSESYDGYSSTIKVGNDTPLDLQFPKNKMYKSVSHKTNLDKKIQMKVPPKQVFIKSIVRIDKIETDIDDFAVTIHEPDNIEKTVHGLSVARYLYPDAIIDFLFDKLIEDE